MNPVRASLLSLSFVLGGQHALAQSHPAAKTYCADDRTSGWNFYCDQIVEEPQPEDPPAAARAPTRPPPASYTEQMRTYRAELDELKHRAILEPTAENVSTYMRAQQDMVRRATVFTEVWQRQIFADPTLDANVKRPLTAMGNNLRQDRLVAERQEALRAASAERGLMFVYAGPDTCMLCEAQAGILADMADRHDIAILPVSRDGIVSEQFPESLVDRGQLARLGLADTPLPFIALVDPGSDNVDLVGAGLMTQDIILDRVRIITAVPEGELYE